MATRLLENDEGTLAATPSDNSFASLTVHEPSESPMETSVIKC
jgi:hypothetical protein